MATYSFEFVNTFQKNVQSSVFFLTIFQPDLQTLGNHEFDYGVEGLVPFLNNVSYPITMTNLNIKDDHPLWKTRTLHKSVVLKVDGFDIGVIGYLLPETISMSHTDDVTFYPEIEAIKYVKHLSVAIKY